MIYNYYASHLGSLLHELGTLDLAHQKPLVHRSTDVGELGFAIRHGGHICTDELTSLQILVSVDLQVGMMTEELLVLLGGGKAIALLFVKPLHLIHPVLYTIGNLYIPFYDYSSIDD